MATRESFDLAVIGAGICGLAHALAAARRGLRVVVIERDARANGASVRNFGLITVTGQADGDCWNHAMRSRRIWDEVIDAAGIEVPQRALLVVARRQEAMAVLEAFRATRMGEACTLVGASGLAARFPGLRPGLAGALLSPHELRVESRSAIPRLVRWLERAFGVSFRFDTTAFAVAPPRIETSQGAIDAGHAVICPGDDLALADRGRVPFRGQRRCTLQMMRLSPSPRGEGLPSVMSDLGLVRYGGYASLPEAAALRARLAREQPAHLRHGVHLIAVRSADGSMVVGDSHQYGETADPFAESSVESLILEEYASILGDPAPVCERWTGTYAWSPDRWMLTDRPSDRVRVVVITSGTGASTSFSIGEQTIDALFGARPDGLSRPAAGASA